MTRVRFVVLALAHGPVAQAFRAGERAWAVQFHPEVAHTPRGGEILNNFLFEICGCTPDWTPGHFVESEVALLGLAATVAAGRLVQPLLFAVTATDPLVLATTTAALLVATIAATALPTRLATRTNPWLVLRDE